jgi:hypothetical protein
MAEEQHNALLDAVDLLTLSRKVRTAQVADEYLTEDQTHTETHPPLLTLLIDGTSSQGGSKSSDPGIPIDADALELWGQVRDLVRLWCKQLVVKFDQDDLAGSIRRWCQVHTNRVRAGLTSEVVHLDVTRMVEGWVRMIEQKYEPPTLRDWTAPCPAWVMRLDDSGEVTHSRCDARWVTFNKVGRFAIGLNITTWTAKCCVCGYEWSTRTALQDLRYESNLWEQEKADREAERIADLDRLANGDTPQENIANEVA